MKFNFYILNSRILNYPHQSVFDTNRAVLTGDYNQNQGTTNLQGGNLDITGSANINDGSLTGFGAISTNTLTNDSLINPGNDTGSINLTGNYTQTANGDLNMEIGGINSGEFDQLLITGTANLNGDLNISLLDGYTPTLGDTFDILTFGDRTGDFTAINTPTLGNGLAWDTQWQGDRLSLVVV